MKGSASDSMAALAAPVAASARRGDGLSWLDPSAAASGRRQRSERRAQLGDAGAAMALVTWMTGCAATCLASSAVIAVEARLELARLHLVRLGEDDLEGYRRLVEHGHQRPVDLLDAVARVDENAGAAQRGAGRADKPG